MELLPPIDFAAGHLAEALRIVQTGGYITACPALSAEEKALIYHYTDTGSSALNRALHAGTPLAALPLGQGLAAALAKLPPYLGPVVYSGGYLTPAQLAAFWQALQADAPVTWPAFLSASCSRAIAEQHWNYAVPNALPLEKVLFLIASPRTGRLVEAVSHHGPSGQQATEQEVLFLPDTRFAVLEISRATGGTEVVLGEL